ncbi:MAG: hypothetical protein H8K06_17790 [Nitrospira sp.]|nr:hypothetical protein [Nitrospira sp.]
MRRWHGMMSEPLELERRLDHEEWIIEREVNIRLVAAGINELPEALPPSPLKIFLAQFSSLIVWVLISAAIVSGLPQEWVETAAILTIVALNAIPGFVHEFRAERSLSALKQLSGGERDLGFLRLSGL